LKLLVSPINENEALEAIAGRADIIDVKNPKEGALGANYPWVIQRIRKLTPKDIEVSCTIGEAPHLPATMALAALGAATTGVNYIKAGLRGLRTDQEAINLLQDITKAIKESYPSINVVATGYADAERIGAVSPMQIPEIAHKANVDFAMLDTAIKDGKNLFSFLTTNQLKTFISEAQDYGLRTALAGSLSKEDLLSVQALGADVVGVRGAACDNGDRISGQITRRKVQELVEIIKNDKK
jgi:(5-formylfuran-3-yl)methyl phosphate synthase